MQTPDVFPQKVAYQRIIAGGNRSKRLEFLEDIFDQMARLAQRLVVFVRHDVVARRRNYGHRPVCLQTCQHPLVGEHFHARQHMIGRHACPSLR